MADGFAVAVLEGYHRALGLASLEGPLRAFDISEIDLHTELTIGGGRLEVDALVHGLDAWGNARLSVPTIGDGRAVVQAIAAWLGYRAEVTEPRATPEPVVGSLLAMSLSRAGLSSKLSLEGGTEVYFNVRVGQGTAELAEKDEGYRKDLFVLVRDAFWGYGPRPARLRPDPKDPAARVIRALVQPERVRAREIEALAPLLLQVVRACRGPGDAGAVGQAGRLLLNAGHEAAVEIVSIGLASPWRAVQYQIVSSLSGADLESIEGIWASIREPLRAIVEGRSPADGQEQRFVFTERVFEGARALLERLG